MWRKSPRLQEMRGALPRSWAPRQAASLRHAAWAVLPRRAGAETEPEWKHYELGDPSLYDNWKGKAPNALPEQVDIDPNDWHAMTPDLDPSRAAQWPYLGTGLAILAGFLVYNIDYRPRRVYGLCTLINKLWKADEPWDTDEAPE